jgi:hypothetical protein
MSITPDQRATLQLLLERGQGYADLATLLAVEEAEVRARARAALTELGGADPDRHVGLTDYLLGQADPIVRADASRHLREDADDHALATTLTERLRELFPGAELPRLPGEPRRPRRARRAAEDADSAPLASRLRPSGLTTKQTRLIVVLGSAAVLLIAVVLAIAGVFGGEDEPATASESTTPAAATPSDELQRVELTAEGGGNARGEAVFGLATGDQPFVDFAIEGLDPAPQGRQYVIWLMLTGDQGYPLSPIAASQQGTYQNRFPIPSAVLPVVARVRFVDVSIAPTQEIRRVVQEAIENTALVLEKPGETVLRGTIPRTQATGS